MGQMSYCYNAEQKSFQAFSSELLTAVRCADCGTQRVKHSVKGRVEAGSLSLDVQRVVRIWYRGCLFFKTLRFTWIGICKAWYNRSDGGEEAFGDSYDQGREK